MAKPQIRRALLGYLDRNPRMKTLVLEFACEKTGYTPTQVRAAIRGINFERRMELHFEPKVRGQSWRIVREMREPLKPRPALDVVAEGEAAEYKATVNQNLARAFDDLAIANIARRKASPSTGFVRVIGTLSDGTKLVEDCGVLYRLVEVAWPR